VCGRLSSTVSEKGYFKNKLCVDGLKEQVKFFLEYEDYLEFWGGGGVEGGGTLEH
jgi:hypothetical protein